MEAKSSSYPSGTSLFPSSTATVLSDTNNGNSIKLIVENLEVFDVNEKGEGISGPVVDGGEVGVMLSKNETEEEDVAADAIIIVGETLSEKDVEPEKPEEVVGLTAQGESIVEDIEANLQEMIKLKFLRLVHRLGLSTEDPVAAMALYRLDVLARSQTFDLLAAKQAALKLEIEEDQNDLDFSINILVLGKSGVGKSSMVNSLFGEDKAPVDAFKTGTASVKLISGLVDGVKVQFIDTPGLKSSLMEQSFNRRILSSVKKITKKIKPDVVLYTDRLDSQTPDFDDVPLLKSVTSALGPSIWRSAIVTLTHAASPPPDGSSGNPLSYNEFVTQRSNVVQQSIRHAIGDQSIFNPVSLVENHQHCPKNRQGQKILPNGQSWISQLLLLCYAIRILSESASLAIPQDVFDHRNLFGFRARPPHLLDMLSLTLQSRRHPELPYDWGGDKNKGKEAAIDSGDKIIVPVLAPEEELYPSFDGYNPAYRYRYMDSTSHCIDTYFVCPHGWDHDYGLDGVKLIDSLAIINRFPVAYTFEACEKKNDLDISLDSSISAKHGENMSSMAGFDIQTMGMQQAYIVRGETELIKSNNRAAAGVSLAFLGEHIVPGVKIEDQIMLGEQCILASSAGAVHVSSQHDTAYGANIELQRIGQVPCTLSMSAVKWMGRGLALRLSSMAQFPISRNSQVELQAGIINNRFIGQVTVRKSGSEHLSLAIAAILPTTFLFFYKKLLSWARHN